MLQMYCMVVIHKAQQALSLNERFFNETCVSAKTMDGMMHAYDTKWQNAICLQ